MVVVVVFVVTVVVWFIFFEFDKFPRYLRVALPCNHLTWVAGPYPFSFLAAILKIMAGLVV